MSISTTEQQVSADHAERVIDASFDLIDAWCALVRSTGKLMIRPPFGGYSPITEAVNLLARAIQENGNGGGMHRAE